MMRKESGDFKHTNSEIVRFEEDYKLIIFSACKAAGLRRCDWESVESEILLKYSMGLMEYDSTRGAKASSYYYMIAWCKARDFIRKQRRLVELDDNEMEHVFDEHEPIVQTEIEDERLMVTEAIRRLVKDMRDKTKVEVLVRFVINGEERQDLANDFQVDVDYISLVKTRYLPRLQKLVKEVLKEDGEGRLKLTKTDISFLKPYMKNW